MLFRSPKFIAVTPFNPNPQTPRGIELVAAMRVSSPSLERPSMPVSPKITADVRGAVGKQTLDGAVTQQRVGLQLDVASPASVTQHCAHPARMARGRTHTLGRSIPSVLRREQEQHVSPTSPAAPATRP